MSWYPTEAKYLTSSLPPLTLKSWLVELAVWKSQSSGLIAPGESSYAVNLYSKKSGSTVATVWDQLPAAISALAKAAHSGPDLRMLSRYLLEELT